MKVAIVLTGHMRCWELVWPNFKEKFIDRFNPDIFISTWDNEGWWRPSSDKGFKEDSPKLDVTKMIEHYKPKLFKVEKYENKEPVLEDLSKKYTNFIHNPKNVVSMFYKILDGISLLESHVRMTGEKYDMVIRMRPDMIFNQDIPEINTNFIYTIDHKNFEFQGTGDMFQAGSYDSVVRFSHAYEWLDHIYEVSNSLCPHIVTKTWIDINKFNHIEFPINKRIVHSPHGQSIPSKGTGMKTVIEVGMNNGSDTRNLLSEQNMVLYGFEPTHELVQVLHNQYGNDPRVKIIPLAVDIENRFATFNIAGWQDWGCSSLNEFTDGVSERWNGFNFHYTKKQSVMTIRLDDFCKMYGIEKIDYLWIDAQGSDFNVLKSLGPYIDVVQAGKVEVSYNVPLYKGVDNTFASVSAWLTEKGFVYDVEYDNEIYKTEANIYFKRP